MRSLSHVFIAVLVLGTVLGAISFDAPRDYRLPSYAVTTGDFNGDGRADVVSGIAGIDLSLTNADATLAAPTRVAPATAISELLAVDLDGDANTDIVASDFGAAAIIVLLGNGDGTFDAPAQYPVAQNPVALVRAQVAGDSVLDLVVASSSVAALTILAGAGDGTLAPAGSVPLEGVAQALAAGRFNADAVDDLLVTVNPSSRRVQLLLGDGAGGFQPPQLVTGGGAYDMTVRDFDGDGHLDFVARAFGLSLFLGTGEGTFTGPTTLPTGSGGDVLSSAVVADFNGDMKADIAIGFACCFGGSHESFAGVLLGNDRGSFLPPRLQSVSGYATHDLAAADFDADGRTDLVTAHPELPLRLRRGLGDGTFEAAVAIDANVPIWLATGDFNGDGHDDYAGLHRGAPFTCGRVLQTAVVAVVMGAGDGTFGAPATFVGGCNAEFIASAEINGDSYPDLVVAGLDTRVFLANGDGSFRFASSNIGGSNPVAAAVADFSGDGVADLAVANAGSPERHGSVAVFGGHGDGTFDPPTVLVEVLGPVSLASADFNGDLQPDLAVANAGLSDANDPYAITVYLNAGGGSFQARFIPIAQPWVPRYLSAADLNGDAVDDLVLTAGSESGPRSHDLAIVLLGNGDGNLRFSAAYGVERWATQALIADLDADGSLDMAVGGKLIHTIHVLRGRGDGTFVPFGNFGVPGFIHGFATGRFGGDARPDLLASVLTDVAPQTVLLTNVTP